MSRLGVGVVLLCSVALLVSVDHVHGYSVLYDDVHDGNTDELSGNLSSYNSLLQSNGIFLTELNGSPGDLTAAALAGYDALFIHDVELAFTTAEINAITDFVANGGGLFITGNAPANFNQASNNALMSNFGITFNQAISPEDTVSFSSHPAVPGLSLVTGDGVARLSVTGDAQLIGFNSSGLGTIAVRDSVAGSGRIIATGDGAPIINSFFNQADNADWALAAMQYVVVPEPAATSLMLFSITALLSRKARV